MSLSRPRKIFQHHSCTSPKPNLRPKSTRLMLLLRTSCQLRRKEDLSYSAISTLLRPATPMTTSLLHLELIPFQRDCPRRPAIQRPQLSSPRIAAALVRRKALSTERDGTYNCSRRNGRQAYQECQAPTDFQCWTSVCPVRTDVNVDPRDFE